MISLRLPGELEQKLNKLSKTEKRSKSEIIKKALLMYLEKHDRTQRPFDMGEDLFGKHGSGSGTLSKDYKNILRERLREKHSR